jgi:hypothetical protein
MDHYVPICIARTKECTWGSWIVEGNLADFLFQDKVRDDVNTQLLLLWQYIVSRAF